MAGREGRLPAGHRLRTRDVGSQAAGEPGDAAPGAGRRGRGAGRLPAGHRLRTRRRRPRPPGSTWASCSREQGDVAGARAAYQQAIDSGHADVAPAAAVGPGDLLREQGDVAGARAAYQQAIDSGHADLAPRPRSPGRSARGAGRRGRARGPPTSRPSTPGTPTGPRPPRWTWAICSAEQGDAAGARAAYQQAIDSGHADWAPPAALSLGRSARRSRVTWPGARAAYQQAIDSGHADWRPRPRSSLGTLLGRAGRRGRGTGRLPAGHRLRTTPTWAPAAWDVRRSAPGAG